MRPNKHSALARKPYTNPSRLVICISCGTPYSLGDKKEKPIKRCNKCEDVKR